MSVGIADIDVVIVVDNTGRDDSPSVAGVIHARR